VSLSSDRIARRWLKTMAQTSRPATAEDLKRILRALNQTGARHLLVGADAMFAHGYQRATFDIVLRRAIGAGGRR